MAELAGTAVGVISLGIQVCQGLVGYYGSWKDAPKDVARICQSIRSLEEMLNVVKTAVKDNGVASQAESGIQSGIDSLATSIAELQIQLIKVQEINGPSIWSKVHGHGRRLLYPFREGTLLKLDGIFAEMRENLRFALDVRQLQAIESSIEQLEFVSTQVNSLSTFVRSHHDDQESIAVVNWLSPLNFFVAQNDILRRRQAGTGEWLFETPEFEAWLAGTDRILWCSGQPGAGKTILASAIVNKLQTQQNSGDVGLAFAYCNYKEHDMQTLANLIGSLVQLLVHCYGAITDEIREIYTQYNPKNIRPSEEEFSKILLSLIGKFSHVYIVVDALDECNPKIKSKFIEKLRELPVNIRLLCTSRRLGDIQEAFNDVPHLEIRASDEDVARYVEAQILQVPKLVRFCKKAGDLQSTIIEKLVKKAKGMFLLAELHLESLKTKTDIKSLRKALDVLPEELEKTYDEALERIQRQPEDESKLAMRVLSWITHAVRPLKVGEIQHAIAVMNFEPEDTTLDEEGLPDEAEIITVCGGSAVIDQDSRIIRLVHYTTQDYFERHRSKIFPTAQADILCACIRYLSLDPFKSGSLGPFKGGPGSYFNQKHRIMKFKLLGYASHNWESHVCGDLDDTTEEQLLQFLNNRSFLSIATEVRWYFRSRASGRAMSLLLSAARSGSILGEEYPKGVPGIVVAAEFGLTTLIDKLLKLGNSIDEGGSRRGTALHEATKNGHEATIRLLLKRGANIEAKTRDGMTALSRAAMDGSVAMARLLLENGADIETLSHGGNTPLSIAAQNGRKAIVQLLLEKGADIEAIHPNEVIALIRASKLDHLAIVKLLLQNGANVEAKDADGMTAQFWIAHHNQNANLQLLLERRTDIKEQDRDAIVLMFRAAKSGDEPAMRLLLEKEVSVEARDRNGMTALLLAAYNGHEAIAQLLLEKGPDTQKDTDGISTVLIKAAQEGWETIVQLMLENGADINAKDQQGMAALLLATKKGATTVVKLLLEWGANVEVKDPNGNTAVVYAAEQGHEAIAQLLLEKGVNAWKDPNIISTALISAARGGWEAIVQLMLENGADINAKDQQGRAALLSATKKGATTVVQLLLEGGANVEVKDLNGNTAVVYAADQGHGAIVQVLLENGADINARNVYGKTALFWAIRHGHKAVAQLLLMKGATVEAKDDSRVVAS